MTGIDEAISGLAAGHGAVAVLLVAFALGLRHASDPDHLVAVSTLVAGTHERAARAAGILGAAWGAGHATTLILFGLPVIVLRTFLPPLVETAAEALVGAIVVLLAIRLLARWRAGTFHTHVHEHDGRLHLHVHSHARSSQHVHAHDIRSPRQAFGIGLVHGTAGSAGVAVLLVAAVPDHTLAAVALLVLAGGAAVSMALLSAAFGHAFSAVWARRALTRAIPVFAVTALVFGAWYAAAALLSLR